MKSSILYIRSLLEKSNLLSDLAEGWSATPRVQCKWDQVVEGGSACVKAYVVFVGDGVFYWISVATGVVNHLERSKDP